MWVGVLRALHMAKADFETQEVLSSLDLLKGVIIVYKVCNVMRKGREKLISVM